MIRNECNAYFIARKTDRNAYFWIIWMVKNERNAYFIARKTDRNAYFLDHLDGQK